MILRSLLYIIALILIAGWALGYFLWRPGPFIHVMALLAVVALLLGITQKEGIR
ncbi:MAG: lmo0937 family membrane protein [Taibaiella sp.]|nr:lmo0937 family membrane protein [Taibaiella sp.]